MRSLIIFSKFFSSLHNSLHASLGIVSLSINYTEKFYLQKDDFVFFKKNFVISFFHSPILMSTLQKLHQNLQTRFFFPIYTKFFI